MFAKYLVSFFLVVVAFLLAFDATALAATVADSGGAGPSDLLEPVYRAFAHGEYWYAGALALIPAAAAGRRYGGEYWPALRTETGTAAMLLIGSFGASLSARLAGGVELTPEILLDASKNAICAAGGYAILKVLIITPILVPLANKYPRMGAPLKLLTRLFDTATPTPAELDRVADRADAKEIDRIAEVIATAAKEPAPAPPTPPASSP